MIRFTIPLKEFQYIALDSPRIDFSFRYITLLELVDNFNSYFDYSLFLDIITMQQKDTIDNQAKLLQLAVWFDVKYQKNAKVTVQAGSRAPLIHSDYLPLCKVYFYDVASTNQLPTIRLAYNNIQLAIDLMKYTKNTSYQIGSEQFTVHFNYELLSSTDRLYEKYCSIREPDDKFARGQGICNFIRAESQFLSLFERNEQIELIKTVEAEEQSIERVISDDIIKLQKSKTNVKGLILIFLLLFTIGYLFNIFQNDSENIWLPPASDIKPKRSRSSHSQAKNSQARKKKSKK